MKKVVLFFSIFLISLIIGCSVESPVTVSSNNTGDELYGLGTQYEWLVRTKIMQKFNKTKDSVIVNRYSKMSDFNGSALPGDTTYFNILNTTFPVRIERTVIWAMKNHGHTNTFEVVYLITDANQLTISNVLYSHNPRLDTLHIPDIPFDSRGFRCRTDEINSGTLNTTTTYKTYTQVGTHLNGPPFNIALKVDLQEDSTANISPIIYENKFFEAGYSLSNIMWFHTKKNKNPSSYIIKIDPDFSYFKANKYYYISNVNYYDSYTLKINIYDENESIIGYLQQPLDNIYINVDGEDYQGFTISDSAYTFIPEKQYGIKMEVLDSKKRY